MINMVLKQKKICPLHYPSHPEGQGRATHSWGRVTHQERYKLSHASGSPGVCSTMFLDPGYVIGSMHQ